MKRDSGAGGGVTTKDSGGSDVGGVVTYNDMGFGGEKSGEVWTGSG